MTNHSSSIALDNHLLRDIVYQANATGDLRQVLAASLQSILRHLDADKGLVCLIEDNHIDIAAQQGLDELTQVLSAQPARLRICNLGDEPQTLALSSQNTSDVLLSALFEHGETQLLIVPITSKGLALGYAVVVSDADAPLEAEAQTYWAAVGHALGLAVTNDRYALRMERQIRESQMLYRVSQTFVTTPDLDALLNLIVHSAVDTIDKANNCVLHLYDEKTDELQPRALSLVGRIIASNTVGRSRMHIGEGIAGYALKIGQVVNIADVDQDPRFVRVGATRSFASMLVAPLLLNERRIGTLSVDSQEPHAFSSTDARLLMTLATQAAAAIENARLVNDLQKSLTDLKAAQAQLLQSEKLSAIGQLIAGVAHELNNPLTAVIGYTQLLQTSGTLDEEAARDLEKIYTQAQRAAKIVQNLLTFARQHTAVRERVNINDILNRTIELRNYQIRVENIDIVRQLEPGICTVGDPHQLQQVFLNLINNAMDALVEQPQKRGRITIVSSQLDDRVQVRISDDGPGIPLDAQKHLFEPFYTTKEVGKGTGLGLSICFGIISQHGGNIYYDENDTEKTTFVVELPKARYEESPSVQPQTESSAEKKKRRILVVDDELAIAAVIERVLLHDGHDVWLARNGQEALARIHEFDGQDTRFDLVISDVKMPGLSGPSLYHELSAKDPEMAKRIIFITGDTLSLDTQHFIEQTNAPCLAKPFTLEEFRAATANMLA